MTDPDTVTVSFTRGFSNGEAADTQIVPGVPIFVVYGVGKEGGALPLALPINGSGALDPLEVLNYTMLNFSQGGPTPPPNPAHPTPTNQPATPQPTQHTLRVSVIVFTACVLLILRLLLGNYQKNLL